MKKIEIKKRITDESMEEDNLWIDDSLEDDALDLEEWAFMQGYYQNN